MKTGTYTEVVGWLVGWLVGPGVAPSTQSTVAADLKPLILLEPRYVGLSLRPRLERHRLMGGRIERQCKEETEREKERDKGVGRKR